MKDVEQAFWTWKFMAEKHFLNKTAIAEDLCLKALEFCWGSGSKIEFSYENLEMRCFGPNGEYAFFKNESPF